MCLRTSFSHRCLGYMSCSTNGLGVLSSSAAPFCLRTNWVHANMHRHEHTQKLAPGLLSPSFFFLPTTLNTTSLWPFFSFFSSSLTSVFQIWLCTPSSAPHIAVNNERVTRSMRPCKIQHNAASVTGDVIAGSPCDLRVNVISIHVNVWRRFNPCAWQTGHTQRLD